MFMQVIKETEISLIFSLFTYSVFLVLVILVKITVNNSTPFLSKSVNFCSLLMAPTQNTSFAKCARELEISSRC